MPLGWDHIFVEKIREWIINHGIDVQPLDVHSAIRADLITWLDNHNLTPHDFWGTTVHHHHAAPAVPAVPPPAPPRPVKLHLPQADNEQLYDFVRRFECAVVLQQIPQDKQVAQFQLNLAPKYAKYLTDFAPQVLQNYPATKAALYNLCKLSKTQFYHLFQSAVKTKDETFETFKTRLLQYYLEYAELTLADLQDARTESLIHAALMPRILDQMPKEVSQILRNFALTHTLPQVVQEADQQISVLPTQTWLPCPHHPTSNHTLQQCRSRPGPSSYSPLASSSYRPPPRNPQFPTSYRPTSGRSSQPRYPSRHVHADTQCFNCNGHGHLSRDCPAKQGN
jgi:hypothetical protein